MATCRDSQGHSAAMAKATEIIIAIAVVVTLPIDNIQHCYHYHSAGVVTVHS